MEFKLDRSGVKAEDVVALALDGGTHIAVLLDRNDAVIRPAIYWSDTRSARQAAALAPVSQQIAALACNPPSTVWTLPQLIWLRENEPENHGRIRKIMFLKDYIRYRLTGVNVTDSIEAMGSMLLNNDTGKWDDWLCSLCDIEPSFLPDIVEPGAIVGALSAAACGATGLSPHTLVCAGATDTVMEVYASGAIKPGQATLKLATAGRICVVTDKAVVSPLLVTYRHIIPRLWYPGTATKTCAAALRWYRDSLCAAERRQEREGGPDAYRILDKAAGAVPVGSAGLQFHPYLQGEITPYPDAALRASFTNISTLHTKGHFDRAVMEGVAYSMRDCMRVIGELGIEITDEICMIGGGSRSPLWRQIVSDVLDVPLRRALTDDSSVGSAMLAGVASGMFGSYEESVELCSRTGESVYPQKQNRDICDCGFEVYRRVHDALAPIYDEINL